MMINKYIIQCQKMALWRDVKQDYGSTGRTLKLEWSEYNLSHGTNHTGIGGDSVPSRANHKWKSPETRIILIHGSNSPKASYAFSEIRKVGFLEAAAAAKSLQSCPTLCGPIDGSLPGFPAPGPGSRKHKASQAMVRTLDSILSMIGSPWSIWTSPAQLFKNVFLTAANTWVCARVETKRSVIR